MRQGLFPSEGGFWLRQRRMVQHTLHRERIRAYGTTVVNAAGRHVAGLKNGERCNAHSDMRQLALEIIAKTPFDIDLGEHAAPFEQAMNALFERNVALHAAVRGPGPRRRRPPSPFRTPPPASTCSPPCWLHRTTSSAA